MDPTAAQDRRFAAIAAAAAGAMRSTEYHRIRTQDVAARVQLESAADRRSAGGARSAVWLYNEVRSRRVLVALGARHAWNEFTARSSVPAPLPQLSVLTDAISTVALYIERIVRFHRVEKFLITQTTYGIGDIATSEKKPQDADSTAPQWPDSMWGRLAEAAYGGRCAVYTDYLAPVLLAAARSVVPLGVREAEKQAAALSDLIFHGLASDVDGPTDQVAAGFAAYWFERDLVPAAGRWVRDLHAAELALRGASRRDTDPRAEQSARSNLIRVLMDADTLHARAAIEGAARTAALMDDLGRPFDPAPEHPTKAELADLRALCDATSRHGLALYRYGDLEAAVTAFHRSRSVAVDGVATHDEGEGRSFAARADHNLADAAFDLADHSGALAACDRAYTARAELLDAARSSAPAGRVPEAAWRRYLLTAELRALLTARLGRPAEACESAETLLEQTARELGRADDGTVTARLRSTFGEILAEAGHPLEARHHLEAVHRVHNAARADAAVSLREYRNRLRLVRVTLDLGDLDAAHGLLPDEETLAWCAARVSLLAAAQARRLRALAHSLGGNHDEADEQILRALTELSVHTGFTVPEACLTPLLQARGVILHNAGRHEAALTLLEDVRTSQSGTTGALFTPDQARTLMWLARAADSLGDPESAGRYHRELVTAAATALEPTHPVLLEAGVDQAARLLRAGDFAGAARLVEPALDRTALGRGRPAVENGHPLLDAARALADSLGLRADSDEPRWDED